VSADASLVGRPNGLGIMRFSSPFDDAYAIGNDDSEAAHGVVNCRSIRHLLRVVFILSGEVMTLGCGYSQSASTAVNGTIADPSTAQIPDARIVVRDVDTGIQQITGVVTSTENPPGQVQLALSWSFR
jgi:hypothetical protein